MEKIVECVPNFSEGRDSKIISKIADAVSGTANVELLDVDSGAATNRTVITMVGDPEAVLEAAFKAIETAASLIDMSHHKGAHPRLGATDVCPFIPVRNMTMDECTELASRLGKRVGETLGIPVYLYEFAATHPDRKNLATIRQGEYEGLMTKIQQPEWKPDFGPAVFNPRTGATVIGARKFLIAYNVNINSRNQRLAHNIALDIRERGRYRRNEDGKFLTDTDGNKQRQDGMLKECKAVGWYIKEYDRAQVSINLTDYEITPPHLAFESCIKAGEKYGVRITGSELVGLIPLDAMLQTGRYFLKKQNLSTGIPERMIIHTAIQSLGLNELTPFDPDEKIIEYRIARNKKTTLIGMRCHEFLDELSTDSPAPGGGSVAALCGALGASLAAMVANLTSEKKGYDSVKSRMIQVADTAQHLKDLFSRDVDRDTDAFNVLMNCFAMPKDTPELAQARKNAIRDATQNATLIPFGVLERCMETIHLAEIVAGEGNPNSISDSGVAILTARTAAEGAFLNVMINLQGLDDPDFVADLKKRAFEIRDNIRDSANRALGKVYNVLKIESSNS